VSLARRGTYEWWYFDAHLEDGSSLVVVFMDKDLAKVIHDWYWAQGQAGPYSVIASLVTAHERYGYAELPIFMLARDGEVVADDSGRVQFEALDTYVDETTRKPLPPSPGTPIRAMTSAGSSRSHATAISPGRA
jgi:hypothetical protein